jgi:hypothetical protein
MSETLLGRELKKEPEKLTVRLGVQVGTQADELSTPVVVSGLDGKHMFLRLRKRPGFEDEDVLDEANVTQTGMVVCPTVLPHATCCKWRLLISWHFLTCV